MSSEEQTGITENERKERAVPGRRSEHRQKLCGKRERAIPRVWKKGQCGCGKDIREIWLEMKLAG